MSCQICSLFLEAFARWPSLADDFRAAAFCLVQPEISENEASGSKTFLRLFIEKKVVLCQVNVAAVQNKQELMTDGRHSLSQLMNH